ncbi:HNH endonuclease [Acidomonas methanolica]|uniref:HNH endonuclease n=1 Tax=Acidomonas methanolica NBRC 104435 TaxID=1231351 RepID=A0A023D8B4_ACIMT|nr:hypothetical protein [Acidomonas methanolica]MBU2653494.1 hypothetical protein [Acidomonas methanolica]TCS25771.1 hypothetical protein EDC31_11651 [Acidomonas methanolica]GAJ30051.1 hypothetical protein Amme_100_014 [Acidomonas methanolica NBRC 104435]GBQ47861.1 lambdoid prophage protein [Acidomonas methanolica]GEK99381.1 HNH endonuclease [Acidomonas methanolica NBRC 104435]
MWSLERPTPSAWSVFTTCISKVRNPGLAARLANAAPTIATASAQFDRAARHHRLHDIAAHDIVAPDITVREMEKVYTQRMAKSGAPGRDIYDEIFASAPAGRCPLCMQRFVATLDHHLPKAHYPALAVVPLNLIPACSDCNKAKLDAVPATAEDVPLHPYYDDLGDDIWLTATVIERRPTALRFDVARPGAWDDTLYARVNHHFRSLGLAALFASEAAEELLNIRHQLQILSDVDPEDGVREELERRAESCAVARTNGWRSAAYRAWSTSDWFCDGGFLPDR